MTEGAFRSLSWESVDPLVAGPWQRAVGAGSRPFAVPTAPPGEFQIGRLRGAENGPEALPALDRLAAVPLPRSEDVARTAALREVIGFEAPGERPVPLCAISESGDVHWSVDPVAWIQGLLGESYVARWTRPLPSRVPFFNYARMPHAVKGVLERLQSPLAGYASKPCAFPSVPVDDLVESVRHICATMASPAPLRAPSIWPNGCSAAVTLTHDVDTGWILDDRRSALLREILDAESSLGFRGAWYVTAQQLSTRRHGKALESLLDAGCELGAHGWNHDARLNYLSAERQEGRMRRIAARFAGRAVEGMRTPWYCRSEQLHRVLDRHFQYDSSVPNASGFFSSETNSGCCSFLPYRTRSGIMELPMTLPPDTAIDGKAGYDELLRCADPILALGGVVVVTMHPQPHQSGSPAALRRYLHFLEQLAERCSDRAWRATPREIVRHYEDALLDRGLVGGTR